MRRIMQQLLALLVPGFSSFFSSVSVHFASNHVTNVLAALTTYSGFLVLMEDIVHRDCILRSFLFRTKSTLNPYLQPWFSQTIRQPLLVRAQKSYIFLS